MSESEWCVTAEMNRRNGSKNYISTTANTSQRSREAWTARALTVPEK